VQDIAPEGVQDSAPKESQSEESHLEESHNTDLDHPSPNRKNRDSWLDSRQRAAGNPYSRLSEALADYMEEANQERICPSERTVVDIMDAAGGATEEEVLHCLEYLYHARTPPRHETRSSSVQLVQNGRG
jgi:hypothetical protein